MCTSAVCDKIKQSADGAIQAVIEFITRRGNELNEADVTRLKIIFWHQFFMLVFKELKIKSSICRTTQSILLAASFVTDKHSRQEILQAVSIHLYLIVYHLKEINWWLGLIVITLEDIMFGGVHCFTCCLQWGLGDVCSGYHYKGCIEAQRWLANARCILCE